MTGVITKIAIFLITLLLSSSCFAVDTEGYKYCSIAGYFRGNLKSDNDLLYLSALYGASTYGIDTAKWNDPLCVGAFNQGKSVADKHMAGKTLNLDEAKIRDQAQQFHFELYDTVVRHFNFKK